MFSWKFISIQANFFKHSLRFFFFPNKLTSFTLILNAIKMSEIQQDGFRISICPVSDKVMFWNDLLTKLDFKMKNTEVTFAVRKLSFLISIATWLNCKFLLIPKFKLHTVSLNQHVALCTKKIGKSSTVTFCSSNI